MTTQAMKGWGPITEFTIALHCGCDVAIVERQRALLKPLEQRFKVHWNNRIDRHPGSYDSYSELINEAVVTSSTEVVILINDRTLPKVHEVEHLLELLSQGYAAATKYSVGFLAVTKQLFRTIGWWDERYYGAGYEDDEFVLRLRAHNLAYYESLEGEYEQTWKSPLRPKGGDACARSEPFFFEKWRVTDWAITQVIPDETYSKYEGRLGAERADILRSWLPWDASVIGKGFYQRPTDGPSRTRWFRTREGAEFREVVPYGQIGSGPLHTEEAVSFPEGLLSLIRRRNPEARVLILVDSGSLPAGGDSRVSCQSLAQALTHAPSTSYDFILVGASAVSPFDSPVIAHSGLTELLSPHGRIIYAEVCPEVPQIAGVASVRSVMLNERGEVSGKLLVSSKEPGIQRLDSSMVPAWWITAPESLR